MIQLTPSDLKALNKGLYLKNISHLVQATYMGTMGDVKALRDMVEDPEVVTMLVTMLNTAKTKNKLLEHHRDWSLDEVLHRVRDLGDKPKVTPLDVAVTITAVMGVACVLVVLGVVLALVFG